MNSRQICATETIFVERATLILDKAIQGWPVRNKAKECVLATKPRSVCLAERKRP